MRLLGSFQVVVTAGHEARFESQRARALFAYLVCHPGRAFARERLAELLWPDEPTEVGRKNLRQALYNIGRSLAEAGLEQPILEVEHQQVRLAAGEDCWVDAAAFEAAVARGLPRRGPVDGRELARAVQLYRGDLLEGAHLSGGADFETWLLAEQERLREVVLRALRALVEQYALHGDYDHAVPHARRLIELDPLSEESHRRLMRLYALSGRRGRALQHYETLRQTLDRELDTEPMEESQRLYERLRAHELPAGGAEPDAVRLAPLLPLVGREAGWAALGASFEHAVAGAVRCAVVSGEPGVGKTRLILSFLNSAVGDREVVVLRGRCEPGPGPRLPLAALTSLLGAPRLGLEGGSLAIAGGADAVAERLARLQRPRPLDARVTLVLFLDGLEACDAASRSWLQAVLERLDGPVWSVLTEEPGGAPFEPAGMTVDRVELTRLEEVSVAAAAEALVGPDDASVLTAHLLRHGQGLPLRMAELVNLLWDEGHLVHDDARGWSIAAALPEDAPADLDELVLRRAADLPSSARGLLAFAAVAGPHFDVDLLRVAADEHVGVVEIALELTIERGFIRRFNPQWSQEPLARDLVLWAEGARRGTFRFSHHLLRRAVYHGLTERRRRQLHAALADTLAARGGDEGRDETIAFHRLAAGEADAARPHVAAALERARAAGDDDAARWYAALGGGAPAAGTP